MVDLKTGDVVELREKYHSNGKLAIILAVHKCESLREGGWITFDYRVMTNKGIICSINSACIERKVSSWS